MSCSAHTARVAVSHLPLRSDPAAPRWDMVDVQWVEELPRFVTLEELKRHKDGKLAGMQLFTHLRLSIQPISQEHW